MAGIGILLTRALVGDGQDIQRFGFSSITQRAQSGMSLRRQKGGGERAISGVASTAQIEVVAENVPSFQYKWLEERIGLPVTLRTPTGFSGRVAIADVQQTLQAARSELSTGFRGFSVRIVFYVIARGV